MMIAYILLIVAILILIFLFYLDLSFDYIPMNGNKRRVILWYTNIKGERNYILLWVENNPRL